ncbi:MAG: hypothetical protein RSD81_04675 [Pseudomonas sp.]
MRKAREEIFDLVTLLSETQAKKVEFAAFLGLRGAEAAAMRKKINDLTGWSGQASTNLTSCKPCRTRLGRDYPDIGVNQL